MGCLCCGAVPEVGALCQTCALQIAPCEGLIADHIHSRIEAAEGEAWMVDGFGGVHAVGASAKVGRSHDRELIVLAGSVSREHAELQHTEGGWIVRDLGSRNGTFVNDVRSQDAVAIPARARLKFGDVAFWFLREVVEEFPQQPTTTIDARKGKLTRYVVQRGDLELSVVVSDDAATAGTLMWRLGDAGWAERDLTALEFQLMRALCLRAFQEAGSPATVRGCVSTKQLLRELPFQSKYANHENVRQIVLRLRGILTEIGASGLLSVSQGRGYYLACRAIRADLIE